MTSSASSKETPPSAPARDPLASLRIERPEPAAARRSGRKRGRRLLVALPLVIVCILAAYWLAVLGGWQPPRWLQVSTWVGGTNDWVPAMIQQRPEVRLIPVVVETGRSAEAVVVATGYLESRRQARIGARAPGRIQTINFDEGSQVTQDDVLAVLEHADLEASLAAAVAQVSREQAALAEQEIIIRQAQRDMDRVEAIWSTRAGSEAELDQARFAYQSAVARKASLAANLDLAVARQKQAEQLMENMFIRAPFDGTVISKDAEVGESILPGGMGEASGRGSVATIADLEHLEVECDVKEDFIARVSELQLVDILVDAVPDKKYHGHVRKIIPMGDRARATIKVQVEITDADELLFPEMSGTVYFLPRAVTSDTDNEKRRIFCPLAAVTPAPDGRGDCVWTVDDDGRAQPIAVSKGESRDGRVEIISGLSGEERVIANPLELTAGKNVKVLE